ncbi:serine/threonine-protein kinase [Streptomyces sp. NBC_01317]|uniref:serine/threonine-protein kinase n=1 Tax=Streptomyces sp. NBC_01317 TaxID=2903822 RepID=UPI002E0E93B8|nr:serine/threonine-protein kinase [Streptomyces sp. NBC_01317]
MTDVVGELGPVPLSSSDAATVGGYTLIDRLGSGGMGMVYLARSASGRQVAVKLVHAQFAENDEFRARFRQEIAAARRVSGAFTAPVVDADPEAERPWMATLYVPGPTLAQRVTESGPLAGAELRTLALGLCEALRDIHQAGVVHRDLKPANVLLAGDGPRVIDFGISRAADSQALTTTGRAFGTPPFMSPEQMNSTRGAGPASDVFSLAAVLVFAACGRGPFDAESAYLTAYNVVHLPPVLDDVAEPLRSIVARCLEKDPRRRPGLDELLPLFQGLPADGASGTGRVAAPVVTTWDPASRHTTSPPRVPRRRVLLASLTAGLALAGLGAVAVTWYGGTGGTGTGDAAAGATPGSDAPGAPAPTLPKGWQPWQTTLRTTTPLYGSGDSDSGCLVSGEALYCGGEGFTAVRLDAATGTTAWRFSAGVESSTPVLARDGVVVVNDHQGPAWSTEKRQWVTGLGADDGKARWTHSVADGARAAAFGTWVVVLSVDERYLIAMNADDGTEAWRFPVPAGMYCDPWSGDVLYALCYAADAKDLTGTLWRFDPADGDPHEVGAVPYRARPAGVDGSDLVLLEYPVDPAGEPLAYSSVVRVDTTAGTSRRVPLPKGGGVMKDDATRLIGGTLYTARADGTVSAVSARTGEERWRRATEVQNLSAPVWSETYDELYFVTGYGGLLALDKAGGEVWRTPAREGARPQAEAGPPHVYLTKDAVVALTGGLAFSVSPVEPDAPAPLP